MKKTSAQDKAGKVQRKIQELIRKIECTKAPEGGEIEASEANPDHETYPWGYFFRSQVILKSWEYALMEKNLQIDSVGGGLHAFVVKEKCAKSAECEKVNSIDEDAKVILPFGKDAELILPQSSNAKGELCLDQKTLYVFPSPYKHPAIYEFFSKGFFKKPLETEWQVSEKKNFYFGYSAKTVEILYQGKKTYSPEYIAYGENREFVDYASIINLNFEYIFGSSEKKPNIRSEFDKICIFGGCHRLGTGAAAYVVSHPKFLKYLLSEILHNEEICYPGDSFEVVLKVRTTKEYPLVLYIYPKVGRKIDNIEEVI